MQQCTNQSQRLQQVLNFFVDYLHNEVVKPYTDKFLKLDPKSIEADLILSTWLRE
jgi:UDP-galactopyranose mutase